jgi:anhydro-N-acetylmuramic acid kinase
LIQDPQRAVEEGLYIGLISGTSMDGVDAALVSLENGDMSTLASLTIPYPEDLKVKLLRLIEPNSLSSIPEMAALDVLVGRCFAQAANRLVQKSKVNPQEIIAIGSHGQTLWHSPDTDPPYSVQIGDAATIAALSGIRTVADFRSSDLAYGGQGAPLVPPFHDWRFRCTARNRAVINIGGIANISILPADSKCVLVGFDTGPGNCMMDEWCRAKTGKPFDAGGHWAATGTLSAKLLERFMDDPYLEQSPPKSTGREVFNLDYIKLRLAATELEGLPDADVQRTLLEFSVESIAKGIESERTCTPEEIFVCGGGIHNDELLSHLRRRLPACDISSTTRAGLDPDMVEASAFAWFASRRVAGVPVTMTTGEPGRSIVLGGIFDPTPEPVGQR